MDWCKLLAGPAWSPALATGLEKEGKFSIFLSSGREEKYFGKGQVTNFNKRMLHRTDKLIYYKYSVLTIEL